MRERGMTLRRLFHYATWAAFMVTGTLFVTNLVDRGRHDASQGEVGGKPSFRVTPRAAPRSPRETPIHIDVYEYGFAPSNTIIKAGQAIAFRNVGKAIHNVVPASNASERAFRDAEEKGSARPVFETAGTYTFTCSIHPQMKGKVTVVQEF
jgi:plastocyanin